MGWEGLGRENKENGSLGLEIMKNVHIEGGGEWEKGGEVMVYEKGESEYIGRVVV
jgi:hypothetical protein